MLRILGMTIFCAFASLVWGQTSGNPFDLKFRSSKPAPTTITPKKTPVDTVVRIVQPNKELPAGSEKQSGVIDTISKTTLPANQSPEKTEKNPFELKSTADSLAASMVIPGDSKAGPEPVGNLVPPGLKHKSNKGFQIFFVLLSLLLLIFVVNVERSFVRDLWKVISNENYSSLHHRNQRNTMRQILLIMGYSVFVMQTGLFLYHALQIYHYQGKVLDNIWTCIALVLGIYLVRHGVIRYLRWLFNNDKEMTLFGFDISIFNTMVGLVLLPVNILLLFGPESIFKPLIIIGVISIGAAYLLRQLRWMLSARQLIAHSLFLFFVYLCAVEILPLWAISKLFW
jgi:Domain of unknown function (DUF4271)